MPKKNGQPTSPERLATIETNVEYIQRDIGEIKESIKDTISPLLLDHEHRITVNSTEIKLRNGTKIKLLAGGIGGSSALAGIIYGILNSIG